MNLLKAFGFTLLLMELGLSALAADDGLCETHDWFKLDQEVHRGSASLLCHGAADANFERRNAALKRLHQVVRTQPHSASAYRAHELLLSMHFRAGQYREALLETNAMLAEKPIAEDALEVRPLLVSLSRYPDLSISRKHSVVTGATWKGGNPHLPVTADGKEGLFFMDTGANISTMSDAEAQALGLTMQSVSTKLGDISGTAQPLRIAEVHDLVIGKTHLRNVAFVVLPASQPPFNEIPVHEQALLGIQVILALQVIHIKQGGVLEIGGPSSPSRGSTPIAFDQMQPYAQMELQDKTLTYSMDTGAVHTTLNPPFARAFPDLLRAGEKKEHTLTGMGGSTNQDAVELSTVTFSLAGQAVQLKPATVLTKETTGTSAWAGGNLGFDLIQQLAPFTIDFRRMKFIADR